MDKKEKIKKIRELVKKRIKLSKDIDDLEVYKSKIIKVRKKYDSRTS